MFKNTFIFCQVSFVVWSSNVMTELTNLSQIKSEGVPELNKFGHKCGVSFVVTGQVVLSYNKLLVISSFETFSYVRIKAKLS